MGSSRFSCGYQGDFEEGADCVTVVRNRCALSADEGSTRETLKENVEPNSKICTTELPSASSELDWPSRGAKQNSCRLGAVRRVSFCKWYPVKVAADCARNRRVGIAQFKRGGPLAVALDENQPLRNSGFWIFPLALRGSGSVRIVTISGTL
jgi:hypothetical protein